jgi:hypothetical protein
MRIPAAMRLIEIKSVKRFVDKWISSLLTLCEIGFVVSK